MNDHEKYMQEFVEDIPFDAPNGAHRDALKRQLLNAYPRHRLQPADHPAGVWRTIMKSKKTKVAAAAAIVLAALLSLNLFDRTSGIAWATVVQRLETIKTVAYSIRADINGLPGTEPGYVTHAAQDVQVSYEQGAVRIDTSLQTPRGPRNTQTYLLLDERVMFTVLPSQKKYLKVDIGPEQMEQMSEEKGDPVTILKAMLEHDYTELGRRTIDGVPAWGIEVSDPKLGAKMGSFISGGMFDETIVQLWVDEAHELPIRMNATGSSADGQTSMTLTMDHFQWDVEIDPAAFKPEIPDDFELLVQAQWEKGQEGQEIVEVLQLFVEFVEGKYPTSLNTMTVAQAIAPAIKAKFPPGSEKPSQELIGRLMKVDRVGMMYTTLEKEGKEPAYYGDTVSIETPQAILFRWKIDDQTYRVVFGDLSQKDVTPTELAQLEDASQDFSQTF